MTSAKGFVNAQMDVELIEKINSYAEAHHMPRSAAVRVAVEKLVENFTPTKS